MFFTAQKHVGHDCQVSGDFASDIAAFRSDFVCCMVLSLQIYLRNLSCQRIIICLTKLLQQNYIISLKHHLMMLELPLSLND